ncbi:hypothetical protein ABZS66_59815 [Dactylosporangium sp. NPDC005572]|uniref:hypothetical protein n=1 Tax=Dactylosporangium sp. NPDC005572 TaxID=3156889 RepID=UPI0033A901E7
MYHHPYVGSGPYCYANSFAMLLGPASPSTAVIEVATTGPFGMQLIGGRTAFFDAYGWNPELGFDQALAAIGWASDTHRGATLAQLRDAAAEGPVWVGPLEMGHLRHQPEMTGPIGADHYVVVLDVSPTRVLVHDPHGYPYAEVPVADFLAAWEATTVDYGSPYTMRTGFRKVADVSPADAIRAVVPAAIDRLGMVTDAPMPPGSVGNGVAAEQLASMVEAGAGDGVREHLMWFAIRVGARRLADTADCLNLAGLPGAADVAARQARLVGSLQHPIVAGDFPRAAAALRSLAPTYDELRDQLLVAAVASTTGVERRGGG